MSNEYLEANPTQKMSYKHTTKKMREHVAFHPEKNEKGQVITLTEQAHKIQCDVNEIIKKYDKTGLLIHVSQFEAKYGDMTGNDYKAMKDLIAGAESSFNSLPSEIRNEFKNDPRLFLQFMEDPNNRDRAIELGLIDKAWDEALDGIGEHVIRDDDGNIVQAADDHADSQAATGE